MQCPRCHNTIEDGGAFCGNCGLQLTPLYAQGATAAGDGTVIIPDRALPNNPNPNAYPQNMRTVAAPQAYYTPTVAATPEQRGATPAPSFSPTPPPRERRDNRRVIIMAGILVLLAIVVVTAGVLASLSHKGGTNTATSTATTTTNVGAANTAAGLASFSDNANGGLTESLTISTTNLKTPPNGSQYFAWLLNTDSENVKALGPLKLQNGVFTLTAINSHTNFLSQGNLIEITQETGNPPAPSGNNIILKGQYPPTPFLHIGHLLVAFPTTPHNTGLLVGVRDQTDKLNTAAVLLKNAANNHNTFVESCAAQSIIDIAEGSHSQAFQPLAAGCALQNVTEIGDGFGLLGSNGYIKTASNHASFAANGAGATQNIKTHAGHVEIIMTNVAGWTTTADQDAKSLLNNPNDTGKIQELVQSADRAYHGFSPTAESQPQPVIGQGGAIQGYLHGQLMAMLTLTPQ